MNEKELRERFTPRKLENQGEFSNMMNAINVAQTHDDHPLLDEARRLKMEEERLAIERAKIRMRRLEVEQKRKDVNRAYHDLKHEFIMLNPKIGMAVQPE